MWIPIFVYVELNRSHISIHTVIKFRGTKLRHKENTWMIDKMSTPQLFAEMTSENIYFKL